MALAFERPSTSDEKFRKFLGQVIHSKVLEQNPNASDDQVKKTVDKVSSTFRGNANDPIYRLNANRWLWISYRILTRSNPYISIALEACAYSGICTPNEKLDIQPQQQTASLVNDYVIPAYYSNDTRYFYGMTDVYFAGRMIPKSSFTCGGTLSFILYAEFYWPGLGDPCSVQANLPGAIDAHKQYLDNNIEIFGYSSSDFDYSYYQANSLVSSTAPAYNVLCQRFASPNSVRDFSEPFWPCITSPLTQSSINALSEGIAEGQPYTWTGWMIDKDGNRIRVVTDFPMTQTQLYPVAPPKGAILTRDWIQQLTATELASAVSQDWIAQLVTAAWQMTQLEVGFDGVTLASPVSVSTVAATQTLLDFEPLTVGELVDPLPEVQDLFYATSPAPKPPKVYVFKWTCGFSNYPACVLDFIFNRPDTGIESLTVPEDPFNNIYLSDFTPPNNFLSFLDARFRGSVCSTHRASASITGRMISIDWDFCKFANVAKDVLAFMAYIFTAGFLIGSLFIFRGR